MKVLVTGIGGQLGYDIVKVLTKNQVPCYGTDRTILDFTNKSAVESVISKYKPTHVIHCAAYTAVDKAEEDQSNCYKVNVIGTKNIVEACRKVDATLVYFSTDYVFDGNGTTPFENDDQPNPINYYGTTKYEGEKIVKQSLVKYYILRISWVFGMNGNNFVKTMLRLGETRDVLSVVSDQYGSPTYTVDVAQFTYNLLDKTHYGIYHVTNEGICSWYEFANEIFRQTNINITLNAIDSTEFPTKALRPKNSRLSKFRNKQIGLITLPSWNDALQRFLIEYENSKKEKL